MRKAQSGRVGAKKNPVRRSRGDGHWARRVRSAAFRQALVGLITGEVRALSRERVRDVIDRSKVRRLIDEWDPTMVDDRAVADLLIAGGQRVRARLRKQSASVRSKLGARLAEDIDALVRAGVQLSEHAEDLIADTMRQEFMRRLFGDLMFTSLVAFQEKVNPFFGGITIRLLEERIRGFIDLFMPLLQEQATAFAISSQNQRVLRDFFRAIVSHLLEEPLSHYADLTAPEQLRTIESLLHRAIVAARADTKLQELMREMALAFCDDTFALIGNKRIGELLALDAHAGWIAEHAADAIVPLLSRPAVLQFVAAELEGAQKKRERR